MTLRVADADAILAEVSNVADVSPVVAGTEQVIAGSYNWQTRIQAVRPSYEQLGAWQIDQGSFFSMQHDQTASNVAVLGHTVWSNLYLDAARRWERQSASGEP